MSEEHPPWWPHVEPPCGFCVTSFQGWSSFATGASRFASAAKEGVSSLSRHAAAQARWLWEARGS